MGWGFIEVANRPSVKVESQSSWIREESVGLVDNGLKNQRTINVLKIEFGKTLIC